VQHTIHVQHYRSTARGCAATVSYTIGAVIARARCGFRLTPEPRACSKALSSRVTPVSLKTSTALTHDWRPVQRPEPNLPNIAGNFTMPMNKDRLVSGQIGTSGLRLGPQTRAPRTARTLRVNRAYGILWSARTLCRAKWTQSAHQTCLTCVVGVAPRRCLGQFEPLHQYCTVCSGFCASQACQTSCCCTCSLLGVVIEARAACRFAIVQPYAMYGRDSRWWRCVVSRDPLRPATCTARPRLMQGQPFCVITPSFCLASWGRGSLVSRRLRCFLFRAV
jgi:hypothetical protein